MKLKEFNLHDQYICYLVLANSSSIFYSTYFKLLRFSLTAIYNQKDSKQIGIRMIRWVPSLRDLGPPAVTDSSWPGRTVRIRIPCRPYWTISLYKGNHRCRRPQIRRPWNRHNNWDGRSRVSWLDFLAKHKLKIWDVKEFKTVSFTSLIFVPHENSKILRNTRN